MLGNRIWCWPDTKGKEGGAFDLFTYLSLVLGIKPRASGMSSTPAHELQPQPKERLLTDIV
jgi:hypothetical protein